LNETIAFHNADMARKTYRSPTKGPSGRPHGCIRLTNWNAVDVASMARPRTVVRFEDEDSPVTPLSVPVSETGRPEVENKHP
jgi:hypothetical protein